ncbi:hypothetical protein F5148DRAFT_1266632 [Russula earlei]|uniref:Uncharacterized protein n=1 Tax=Russula earlei TaxID=71964 RepID=A0ACC0TRD4_9AGAM|nr:hypothetical protein F5148DRAFT_1266632 [Russula earlei]
MNRQLDQRNRFLERQLAVYTSRAADQGTTPHGSGGLTLRIPERRSPPSCLGGRSSPASTQSEPVLLKTEEQDDIDQIIAPTRHLHLGDNELQLYGPTSIFRLAPRSPERQTFGDERTNGSTNAYRLLSRENPIVDDSQIDWTRHLPQGVPLTWDEHNRLLGLLFRFFTSWALRIIPKLFLRDMHRCLSIPASSPPLITAHYSPMLHNALLAVATAFSDNPVIKDPATRQRYADKAKSCLESECELPKLSAMSALSILANYHSSTNHPTLGYLYFGISARMSQALGLGIDCSPWVEAGLITHAGMLDRNWALWTTFCQDTTWSLYVGREFCTASSAGSQVIPLDPFLGCWPPKENERPNHISATFAATCSLMQIAREVAEVVSDFSRLEVRQEADEFRIAQLDLKLSTWKNDLPSEIDISKSSPSVPQPHQLMLHMTYYWLIILLHRPFYRRRRSFEDIDSYTDHVKPCNRAAAEIMELAGIWRRHFFLRYVPITMIQVVSAAATIFVVAAVQAVSGPRIAHGALESAEKSAGLAILYLREVGESFASATNVADILQNLMQEQVQTRKARRSPGASPGGTINVPPTTSWQFLNSPSGGNVPGLSGDPNAIAAPWWMEFMGAPLDGIYANAQYSMGQSNGQYSSLTGAIEPLSYHQPFGDGLGEFSYPLPGFTLPGMSVGNAVGGDPVVASNPSMMLKSSQEAFYSYQTGLSTVHHPGQ